MDDKKLEAMRHSLSHLMSMAVDKLYPGAGLGVGPAIENGFYQDYDLPEAIGPEILPKLEKEMRKMIQQGIEFKQRNVSFAAALKFYKKDPYKTEMIKEFKKAGEKEVSFYKSDWFDNLCAGPHVKSTKEINPNAFKLTKIAGAYWRGDEKNKMLTRIYGIAFNTEEELKKHLQRLAEAEKRDHRVIGKHLFMFDPAVGLGLPLWKPQGALLWRVIEDFWYQAHLKNGYQLVRSPHIGSRKLWETSGHWNFFNDSMYPVLEVGRSLKEHQEHKAADKPKEEYLLKPMNCPFAVQIYQSEKHSYRELPLRWAECGTVYRYEKSGELSGLTRVRGFTQDDAHIFCAADQVEAELEKVADFIKFIFDSFGFKDYKIVLSLRDAKNKEKYAGNDAGWKFTEAKLEKVAKKMGLGYEKQTGEAAFYGPKLDYKIKDVLGREWQCATLQFDFNLPERFDLKFINAKGKEERPYMLHRALLGSFERFIGLLIEHYAGAFPLWLSPVQIKVLPLSEKFDKYAQSVAEKLRENNLRAQVAVSDESLGKRIRYGEQEKVPYLLIVGEKEEPAKAVAVRKRGQGDLGSQPLDKFIALALKEIQDKK